MTQSASNRRFFAIRSAIAKRAEGQTIKINGVSVKITSDNRDQIERIRDMDAARAYKAAAFGTIYNSRIAA